MMTDEALTPDWCERMVRPEQPFFFSLSVNIVEYPQFLTTFLLNSTYVFQNWHLRPICNFVFSILEQTQQF